MDAVSYKTLSANKNSVEKQWLLVDAENQTLGRLASEVAIRLRGKNKTYFTPHVDCGDNIVVINASKIKLTGKKWEQKEYKRYSGYPGGQKVLSANEVFKKDPKKLIQNAVKGMLPKNKLGRAIMGNLKVYEEDKHEQEAQKPIKIEF